MAKKLLVADDSLTIQKVIKLALSGDGYEIQTVSDGTECLQQISLFRPDVVLIDVGLPGRSAFDIKKAANEDPDLSRLPFVLMSSAFEKVDEAKVALLKFDGRLTKPFDPSNLKGVLTSALAMNSGQTVKDFVPSAAPSTGFSTGSFNLDPSDRSKQMMRPPLSALDSDGVTGEIQLMDPKVGQSNSGISAPPKPDALWSDSLPTSDSHDADIRNLTESTVKMSGLDDLGGWNIEEHSKSSLPPIPDMFTSTGISQPNMTQPGYGQPPDFGSASDYAISMPEHDDHMGLDLEIGSPTPKSPSADAPGMDFGLRTPSAPSPSLEGMVEKQVREQLEILVQGAVKTQLEQMARKALPEIAERVVKAEIRKLLEGLAGGSSD
jgi:two-component system cell cycle response regulator